MDITTVYINVHSKLHSQNAATECTQQRVRKFLLNFSYFISNLEDVAS